MRRVQPEVAAALVALGGVLARPGLARAQDWTTSGYDAQRSSWVRTDPRISPETLRKPGFRLLWTLKVAPDGAAPSLVTPPVLLDFLIGHRGFKSLGFVAAGPDRIVAVDTDLGLLEWERQLAPRGAARAPVCAVARTPNIARPTSAALPSVVPGGAGRGGNPAHSAVGNPGEGAVTLTEFEARRHAVAATHPNPSGPRRNPRPFPVVYALASDGTLHTLNAMTGADAEPALAFVPAHADARGLIVVDDVAYVATVRGCGAAPNAIWALDLNSKAVATWLAPAGIAGSAGPAIAPEGTLYVATTEGSLVALTPRTLAPKGAARARGATAFTSSPLLLADRDSLVFATSNRGEPLRLFDSRRLTPVGTPVSPTPAPRLSGGLASWRDSAGTRWLLAPIAEPLPAGTGFSRAGGTRSRAGIVAWTVLAEGGGPSLRPSWTSPDIAAPAGPVIVNGVVFAVSGGGPTRWAGSPAHRRAAVLYALDGVTGTELWNSGTAITSFAQGGVTGGAGQVYLATADGTLYAFGFPLEH